MDSVDTKPHTGHVEQDGAGDMDDSSLHVLSDEQMRDQMAAHVQASKLTFTSLPSMQLYLYFFIAYCST